MPLTVFSGNDDRCSAAALQAATGASDQITRHTSKIHLSVRAPSTLAEFPAAADGGGTALWIALDGHVTSPSATADCPVLDPDDVMPSIMKIYRSGGTEALQSLEGSYVLVIVEPENHKLIVIRDRLGGRTVHRRRLPGGHALATLAAELRDIDSAPWQENEHFLTNLFSIQVRPEPGETAFSDIAELLPGECLIIERSKVSRSRAPICWDPEAPTREPEEWAQRFGRELERAVIAAIGHHGPVASMLSGGLDSGPITALASQNLARRGRSLIATSWTLEHFARADERHWIETLGRHLGCRLDLFAGDQMLPFSRLEPDIANPEVPIHSAFREVNLECYRRAAAHGCGIILNGNGGDQLYPPRKLLLLDQLRRHDYRGMLDTLAGSLRRSGLAGLLRDPALRHPVGRIIGRHRRRDRRLRPPEWLSAHAAREWQPAPSQWPQEAGTHPFPDYAREMTGIRMSFGLAHENSFANRYGIERRDPFQSEGLARLMLEAPIAVSHRSGRDKWLARAAMRGKLPDAVRLKPRTGLLNSFFDAGFNQNRQAIHALLFNTQKAWQRYVKPEYVEQALAAANAPLRSRLVVNQCIGHALWRRYWEGG